MISKSDRQERIIRGAAEAIKLAYEKASGSCLPGKSQSQNTFPWLFENRDLGVYGLITFANTNEKAAELITRPKVIAELPGIIRKFGATDILFDIQFDEVWNAERRRADNIKVNGWILHGRIKIHIHYEDNIKISRPDFYVVKVMEKVFGAVDECRFALELSKYANYLKEGGLRRIWGLEFLK